MQEVGVEGKKAMVRGMKWNFKKMILRSLQGGSMPFWRFSCSNDRKLGSPDPDLEKYADIVPLCFYPHGLRSEEVMKWTLKKVPIRCLQGAPESLLKAFCLSLQIKKLFEKFTSQWRRRKMTTKETNF